jgi:hypothetical protein
MLPITEKAGLPIPEMYLTGDKVWIILFDKS